jgi:hypothetical protein
VTATALSLLNSGSLFTNARLGQFPTGLGVCNQYERRNCGSPEHQLDNGGSRDFILFQFTVPVFIEFVVIDPWGTWDRDVAYYLGNAPSGLNLSGVTLGGLAGLGFGPETVSNGTKSGAPRTVTIGDGPYNALLFGVPRAHGKKGDDYFKVFALSASAPVQPEAEAVPEPHTFALVGGGLLLIHLGRRRIGRGAADSRTHVREPSRPSTRTPP